MLLPLPCNPLFAPLSFGKCLPALIGLQNWLSSKNSTNVLYKPIPLSAFEKDILQCSSHFQERSHQKKTYRSSRSFQHPLPKLFHRASSMRKPFATRSILAEYRTLSYRVSNRSLKKPG